MEKLSANEKKFLASKQPGYGRCYDCGSTVPGHHTTLCDMAEPGSVKDLPTQSPTIQWWDREAKQPTQEATQAAKEDLKLLSKRPKGCTCQRGSKYVSKTCKAKEHVN